MNFSMEKTPVSVICGRQHYFLRNFEWWVGEDRAFPSLVRGKAESDPMRRKK
jgi:hypothetical protein